MRKTSLPNKVYLPLAIQQLGLKDIGDSNAIRDILQLANEYHLTIHFDTSIVAATSADEPEVVLDADNNYHGSIVGGKPKDLTTDTKFIISNYASSVPHTPLIQISCFLFNTDRYYACDDEGYWLKPVNIHASEFYFERDEFNKFKTDISHKHTGKPNKQSQREGIFRTWICTEAGISYAGKPSLQEAYKKIGRPTQPEVWRSLQKVNPILFKSGEQSFFRLLTLISFAEGTGATANRTNDP
ncbi:MAG TPA: hypothetical protein EYN73_03840 [Chromatiaceae bacterium]|nr:hypothetical protein [Chromatiaceae bacterium]